MKAPLDTVLAKAKRYGFVECNPLSQRPAEREWSRACFLGSVKGLLRKERVNAGHYRFYPVEQPHD